MNTELETILTQWNIWYRLRRAIDWGMRGLLFGLTMALGLAAASTLRGLLVRAEFTILVAALALGSLSAAIVAGLLWRVDRQRLARFFDLHFHLKERISTALELSVEPHPAPYSAAPYSAQAPSPAAGIIQAQHLDAVAAARQVNPGWRFFWQITRPQVLLAAILIAATAVVSIFGGPLFERATQRRVVQQAVQAEIEALEVLLGEIEANPYLTEDQKEVLNEELEKTIQQLQGAETTEQAVAALTSAENELEQIAQQNPFDPAAQQQAQALQEAGNSLLQGEEGGPLESFAQNLAEGDILGAAQDLQNLDLENMSTEELAALAEQLEALADSLVNTNPELAQSLQQAAEALRSGDTQAAQQALGQASQSLSAAAQSIQQAGAVQQAQVGAASGQERIIQAGQNAQNLEQGQPGAGQGQGAGQSPGQGQSGGSGAGSGQSSGSEGQGPEAGNDPISQNNKPGDGGLSQYEPVYAPTHLGGSGGEEVILPGSDQPGGDVTGLSNTSPGDENPSTVPYVDVFPSYVEAYRQAIENGQVPPALRSLVKKYFSSLEP